MSDDPYAVLGVPKTATQDEIKKTYRKLAKRLHPDLHPDDSAKQAEFQEISAAYDLLGDPEKRKRFDTAEIDASGQERPERQYYHHYAGQDAGRRYDPGAGMGDFEDASELFSEIFGRRQRSGGGDFRQEFHARGPDLRYHFEVEFMDAARGTKRQIMLPGGKSIEITIPAGLKDGQTMRLRGKGGPGMGQGQAGDALVTIAVLPHPTFARNGDDIEMDFPITLDEAVLGAKVEVPTISGAVTMTIPEGTSSGDRLRLKGKGISTGKGAAGDQFVRPRIVLPDDIDSDMEDLAKRWRDHASFDPRDDLRRRT